MLDARYIHLHEALGLGAMWLRNGAKVLPNATDPVPHTPSQSARTGSLTWQENAAVSGNPSNLTDNSTHQRTSNSKNTPPSLSALDKLRRQHSESPTPTRIKMQAAPPTVQLSMPTHVVKLLILSVCASLDDIVAGRLFSGEDGILLDKMLAAIHLSPEEAHRSTWLKNLPDFNPKPSQEQVQAALPSVRAEWENCGQPALLLLGEFFEREDVLACIQQFAPETPYFIIPHPMRLLRQPQLKRGAWETLQKVQAAL